MQWPAAIFYLLNKIFLWFSEYANRKGNDASARKWRIASWAVYLAGLPPWVIIFIGERNWIAAALEASGAPSMVLGLTSAWYGSNSKPLRWLDWIAFVSVLSGLSYSVYDFGGLNTVNQGLEIGLVVGFLIGTYKLAKEQASGYLWYVLMHVSCGSLMWIQDYRWLFLQQLISLVFILDAYRVKQSTLPNPV